MVEVKKCNVMGEVQFVGPMLEILCSQSSLAVVKSIDDTKDMVPKNNQSILDLFRIDKDKSSK